MILQPKVWISVAKGRRGRRLRLSAAHNEWNHVGIALLAMEAGFFAEEGLTDVELITFDEESTCWPRVSSTSASTRARVLSSRRKISKSRCASWRRGGKTTPSY